jgi:hypothetical protein
VGEIVVAVDRIACAKRQTSVTDHRACVAAVMRNARSGCDACTRDREQTALQQRRCQNEQKDNFIQGRVLAALRGCS